VDARDVDVLMGTFTKSFGAAGGYVAGNKVGETEPRARSRGFADGFFFLGDCSSCSCSARARSSHSHSQSIIDYIRLHSHSPIYAEPMPPFIVQQIITSMKIIMGEDGTEEGHTRVAALARNSAFVSTELKKRGFLVYGDPGSPIIPVMLFRPANIGAFSRMCLERGIAVVVVGYPATPLIYSRVRLCVSASHTLEDLRYLVDEITEIGDAMGLRVSKRLWVE
jgi:serine palmitoyltransferase